MPSASATGAPIPRGGDAATPFRSLAVRGAIWTMLGFGASQIIRLGFNLIVTRLLYPELFGLISIVFAIVTGLSLFCDAGIEPAVVRDPRGGEPDFLNTAWTMQIIRGFGIAVFCALISWPVSLFYGDRRLLWILPVIGLANLASGFNSTCLLTLRRNMQIRQLVTVEIGTQILSGAVMIVWARVNPTYWALVAGAVSSATIRMAWSHFLMSGRRNRLMWERQAMRELLRFGRWVWVSSILTFLAAQIDRLILGKLVSWQTLGIYGLAAAIAEMPRSLVNALNNDVIYPSNAKSAALPRAELRARIVRHRWPLLMVTALGIGALALIGDGVMRFLYDKRYASGAWMLPLLALGIWPSALAGTVDSSLFAIGQPRYAASANFLKTLLTAIGIPVGFWLLGTTGAVLVVAMNDLPYYGRIAYGLWREGLSTWQQDLKATLFLAAVLALGLFLRYILNLGTPLGGRL